MPCCSHQRIHLITRMNVGVQNDLLDSVLRVAGAEPEPLPGADLRSFKEGLMGRGD